jgi:hypothetical protein
MFLIRKMSSKNSAPISASLSGPWAFPRLSLIQRRSVIFRMSLRDNESLMFVRLKNKAAQPVRHAAFDRMPCFYATPNVCKVG